MVVRRPGGEGHSHRCFLRWDQIRRYQVCAWISSYLDVSRVTWQLIMDRGLVSIEEELRGLVLDRGLDWDRLERDALIHHRAGGLDPRDESESVGGMPLIGLGGFVDG